VSNPQSNEHVMEELRDLRKDLRGYSSETQKGINALTAEVGGVKGALDVLGTRFENTERDVKKNTDFREASAPQSAEFVKAIEEIRGQLENLQGEQAKDADRWAKFLEITGGWEQYREDHKTQKKFFTGWKLLVSAALGGGLTWELGKQILANMGGQ